MKPIAALPLDRLADIELPPPPDWQPLMITLALSVVVVAAIGGWFFRRNSAVQPHHRPSSVALQRLQTLHKEWQCGAINDRDAAYQLATLLRLGLGLIQLRTTPPQQLDIEQRAWQETLNHLNQLRYSTHSTDPLSSQRFELVDQWLQRDAEAASC